MTAIAGTIGNRTVVFSARSDLADVGARSVESATTMALANDESPTPASEIELIARAQEGDRSAFKALYQLHAARVYQLAISPLIADHAQREDILGETFLRALEHLPRFRWQGCGLLPWLARIARNLCLDHLRKRQTQGLSQEDVEMLGARPIDDTLADAEALLSKVQEIGVLGGQIERCLQTINPRYAQIIRFRCIDRLGRPEAAVAMGVSIGTLDVLYFRACRAFRRAFEELDAAVPASPQMKQKKASS
jgi:RNA polymerase sigma-70 factor (ECF subfamily)